MVLLHHTIIFKMSPDSFTHKFIEFPLCSLGHRCESSERRQYRVGVRSARRPGQAGDHYNKADTKSYRGAGWGRLALWGIIAMVRGIGPGSTIKKEDPTGSF